MFVDSIGKGWARSAVVCWEMLEEVVAVCSDTARIGVGSGGAALHVMTDASVCAPAGLAMPVAWRRGAWRSSRSGV